MAPHFISSDPQLLDREFIVRSLQTTYWAGERSREDILASLEHSLCFAAYLGDSRRQIGLARVVSDHVTFSWLCDVFVDPAHRGASVGKALVEAVLADPRVARTKVYLATKDAHGLYERYGFARWEMMRRLPPPQQTGASPLVAPSAAPAPQSPRE